MTDALLKSVESLEDALQSLLLLPVESEPAAAQQQLMVMHKLWLMQNSWRLCFGYK